MAKWSNMKHFLTMAKISKLPWSKLADWGGGGVQQQKRQRTSCDFAGGMIIFVLCLRTFF